MVLWKARPLTSIQALKQGARLGLDSICTQQARHTAPTPKEHYSFWQHCADPACFLSGVLGKKKQSTRQRGGTTYSVIKLNKGWMKAGWKDGFLSWRTNTEVSSFHVEVRAWPHMVKYYRGVPYPPDSPTHTSMFCTTDLCCSLAHWLFSIWLADIVMAWVFSQWFSPLPTLFWVIVERRKERRKRKYHESQSSPAILLYM